MTSNDDRLRTFRELTPLLRSLAYRMLGSVADADDIVQEAFVRWEGASAEEIRSPKAYLTTVITRLCIDSRRSARARHEQYVGTWLPEPVSEAPSAPPDASAAFAESLSVAFLVLLESLSPVERAVYLLHSAFDLEYAEIAPIVGKSEDNCRQIARRATAALGARKPRFTPSREERHHLATAFAASTRAGSLDQLAALFAHDIELWSDGGPSARALREIACGKQAHRGEASRRSLHFGGPWWRAPRLRAAHRRHQRRAPDRGVRRRSRGVRDQFRRRGRADPIHLPRG